VSICNFNGARIASIEQLMAEILIIVPVVSRLLDYQEFLSLRLEGVVELVFVES
jgi:hypothetical protein